MRFIIDTEEDKQRILDVIAKTPAEEVMLQASVDENWKLQWYLIAFIDPPKTQKPPTKKKK